MELGTYLRTLRTSRHLSVESLARRAAIAPRTVRYWETNTFRPRLPEIDAVLTVLQATVGEQAQVLLLMEVPRSERRLQSLQSSSGLSLANKDALASGGDLLRALRHRRHLHLAQVAARIGVSPGTLSRWETGKVNPNPEQIPLLLQALCARPEERAALISASESGALFLAPSLHSTPTTTTVETLQASYSLFMAEIARCENDALHDLHFLSFEAQAGRMARSDTAGRDLLTEIYSRHAVHLGLFSRFGESAEYAHRALELFPRDAKPSVMTLQAAIAFATATVYSGAKPKPEKGIEILELWEEQAAANRPAHEAWLLSSKAGYLSMAGHTEAALAIGQRACRIAERAEAIELRLRQRDLARILIEAGQVEAALPLIEGFTSSADYEADVPYWRADLNLLRAKGLLRLEEKTEAQVWLERAIRDIDAAELDHLRPRADEIARKVCPVD